MNETPTERAQRRNAQLFARASTATLCESLESVSTAQDSDESKLVRAWLVDELERRHPDAVTVLERHIDALPDDENLSTQEYDQILITEIRAR